MGFIYTCKSPQDMCRTQLWRRRRLSRPQRRQDGYINTQSMEISHFNSPQIFTFNHVASPSIWKTVFKNQIYFRKGTWTWILSQTVGALRATSFISRSHGNTLLQQELPPLKVLLLPSRYTHLKTGAHYLQKQKQAWSSGGECGPHAFVHLRMRRKSMWCFSFGPIWEMRSHDSDHELTLLLRLCTKILLSTLNLQKQHQSIRFPRQIFPQAFFKLDASSIEMQ